LGRIGFASPASKRGHPGGTINMVIDFIQKRKMYMKRYVESLFSVSKAFIVTF
jgi:hypothetical protein